MRERQRAALMIKVEAMFQVINRLSDIVMVRWTGLAP
jgi:hypothetical protein